MYVKYPQGSWYSFIKSAYSDAKKKYSLCPLAELYVH